MMRPLIVRCARSLPSSSSTEGFLAVSCVAADSSPQRYDPHRVILDATRQCNATRARLAGPDRGSSPEFANPARGAATPNCCGSGWTICGSSGRTCAKARRLHCSGKAGARDGRPLDAFTVLTTKGPLATKRIIAVQDGPPKIENYGKAQRFSFDEWPMSRPSTRWPPRSRPCSAGSESFVVRGKPADGIDRSKRAAPPAPATATSRQR